MATDSSWLVYMLRCADNSLYTGVTTDLDRRVDEHNTSPRDAKYTRNRRPVFPVYCEQFETRSEAQKREREIKKFDKVTKEGLAETYLAKAKKRKPRIAKKTS